MGIDIDRAGSAHIYARKVEFIAAVGGFFIINNKPRHLV